MKVLFNADDFGLTKGITDGIITSHLNGVVNATTLMMNGHALDYTLQEVKKCPKLHIGIHLVLTWGKPILTDVPALVDHTGHFKFTSVLGEVPNVGEVKREWKAQIEAFLKTGLHLHHIDSHHHVHGWEPLKEIVIELAEEYQVPVRYVDTLKNHPNILLTETLWTGFYADGVHRKVMDDLKTLNASTVEVMTHPAYMDTALSEVSSYVEKREEELAILTSLPIPDWIEIID